MNAKTEPAASVSPHTDPTYTSFDKDAWRNREAERAERFHHRLAGVIAKKEAALDLPDFESATGRRTVKVSFAPKVKSWHYRTYEMHWQTLVALLSVADKKDRKDWCDALTLADLQPDDRAGKGYARAEAGNVNGMDVVGLDYDKGHLTREQLEAKVRETGLEAIVAESYSYANTQMSVTVATRNAEGDVQLSALGKRAVTLDINDWHTISGALVKTHLVEDEGYSANALGEVRVIEVLEDVDEEDVVTIQLRVEHAPLPKLRVFILLDGQFYRGNGENNTRFSARYLRDVWEPLTKIMPPHSDKACKDISRRWYVRGHRPGHKPVPPTHISGKPFTVISVAAPAEPERAKAPRGETGGAARIDWKGFLAADAAADLIDGAVDKRGDAAMPLVSVDCPFRGFHNSTKGGKNQLFLFNAESPSLVPVVKCHSGSCQGHEHSWEDYLTALFEGRDVSAPEYWLRSEEFDLPLSGGFVVPLGMLPAALGAMNERWSVVRIGGKTRYMVFRHDGIPEFLDKTNFTNEFGASYYEVGVFDKEGKPVGVKNEPFSPAWLGWPERRAYRGYGFFPAPAGHPLASPEGVFNAYRGPTVAPKPGSWKRLLAHLYRNVCQRDAENFRWLIGYLAQMLQFPHIKPGTHLVVCGNEGTGKSKLGEWIIRLLSPCAMSITSRERLTGRFNAHYERMLFGLAEEVFWAGDKQAEGAIKALATAEELDYERKGIDPEAGRNYTRLMICSNEDWVVPAGSGGRRWFVLRVGNEHEQDNAYFAAIDAEMENGGLAAMLHDLQRTTLATTVNVRRAPVTPWLIEQRLHSQDARKMWWRTVLAEGGFGIEADVGGQREFIALDKNEYVRVSRDDVFASAKPFFERKGRPATREMVAAFIRKELEPYGSMFYDGGRVKIGNKPRTRSYVFANYDKFRQIWAGKYGEIIVDDDVGSLPAHRDADHEISEDASSFAMVGEIADSRG